MIVKVAWEGVERAVRFVKSRHPYEMPAIMALPVIGGSVEYLEWIRVGTLPQSDKGQ
jgi:periplasmic divalent cation tolerance protein